MQGNLSTLLNAKQAVTMLIDWLITVPCLNYIRREGKSLKELEKSQPSIRQVQRRVFSSLSNRQVGWSQIIALSKQSWTPKDPWAQKGWAGIANQPWPCQAMTFCGKLTGRKKKERKKVSRALWSPSTTDVHPFLLLTAVEAASFQRELDPLPSPACISFLSSIFSTLYQWLEYLCGFLPLTTASSWQAAVTGMAEMVQNLLPFRRHHSLPNPHGTPPIPRQTALLCPCQATESPWFSVLSSASQGFTSHLHQHPQLLEAFIS